MPQSVPYHPALTLGNVISPGLMDQFNLINKSLKNIDRAKEKLDSLILDLRNANMTEKQLESLDIDLTTAASPIPSYKQNLSNMIITATQAYFKNKIDEEEKIRTYYDEVQEDLFLDSPLKYNEREHQSEKNYLSLPWSVDSLKLDYQYFSFSKKSHSDTMQDIKSFIQNSTNAAPNTAAGKKLSQDAIHNLESQKENLKIEGTLIISATCTHKNVRLIHPFELDLSQTINIWNKLYPHNLIDIKGSSLSKEKSSSKEDRLHLVSGAVYGSHFIGMVHLVKNNNFDLFHADTLDEATYQKIKKKLEVEKFLANEMGDIGIDPQRIMAITNSLRGQDTNIYLNIFSTGAIPKLTAQETQNNVESLLKSTETIKTNLEKIKTLSGSADEQQKLSQKISIKQSFSSHILKTLAEIDKEHDKTLDISSLLTAFTNYIGDITKDNITCGIPIGYYIKSYSKQDILDLWNEGQEKRDQKQEDKKKEQKK